MTHASTLVPTAKRRVQPTPEPEAKAIRAPAQVVALVAVGGVGLRMPAKNLLVLLASCNDLTPLARLHPLAVKCELEAALLQEAHVTVVLSAGDHVGALPVTI